LQEAATLAAEQIDSRRALQTLERYVAISRTLGEA
jgi:anthranilate phosphoribosyltransferase